MRNRKRWAGVAAVIAVFAVIEALSDSVFDPALPFPFDTIVVITFVTVLATIGAGLAFRTIDNLTGTLMQRNADLESRNAALHAMYDTSLAVSVQVDPEETIGSIVDRARDLLRCDVALIVLDEGEGFCLRAVSPRDAVPGPRCDDPGAGGASSVQDFAPPGLTVALEAPITRDSGRIGSLAVATASPRQFQLHDVEALDVLGTQVGIALEAARLKAEVQALAVQGERERIARDMHDGLAQVLGYVNTKSQAVEGLLADGKVEEARSQAAELSAAARSVYVDVREAILNLSTASTEVDLARALRDYAERYSESSKLAVRCDFPQEVSEAVIPAAIKAEVFRIVREALTNVRKHASANRVHIAMAVEDAQDGNGQELVVSVTDDGRGFDTSLVGVGPETWPHFGIAGMRERATMMGARIEWQSSFGSGTRVELRVPIGEQPRPAPETTVPTGALPAHASDRRVQPRAHARARAGD